MSSTWSWHPWCSRSFFSIFLPGTFLSFSGTHELIGTRNNLWFYGFQHFVCHLHIYNFVLFNQNIIENITYLYTHIFPFETIRGQNHNANRNVCFVNIKIKQILKPYQLVGTYWCALLRCILFTKDRCRLIICDYLSQICKA